MKKEDLFEAIGGVDDALLEEKTEPAKKRHIWPAVAGLAACAAAVALAVRFLPGRIPVQPDESIIEVPMTAETYEAAPPVQTETQTMLSAGTNAEQKTEPSPAYESASPYPGIWYARALGTDEELFYCFREDGTGSIRDAKTGVETTFTYQVKEEFSGLFGTALHFDFGETSSHWTEAGFTIQTDGAETYAYLSWDPAGESARMQYVCEGDFDSFTFYTDEQLCEIVGKLHGVTDEGYALVEFDLVPSVQFPQVVVCVTAGEWRGHWYYIANRLTGEAVKTDQTVMP